MGNILASCFDPMDALPSYGNALSTMEFLEEIGRRVTPYLTKDVPTKLRKIICISDLAPATPPAENRIFVQNNVEFLATGQDGVVRTLGLVHYIIRTVYEMDVSLTPAMWKQLFENVTYAANLVNGRNKLLQLSFLSHISKQLPKKANAIKHSRTIQYSSMENNIPVDEVNRFFAAARSTPAVNAMIPPGFITPQIVPFVMGYSKSWDFHGFVLDGNFIAVNAVHFLGYDIEENPMGVLYANNICFHEYMHAANRQHYNSFQIHTPQRHDLIPTTLLSQGAPLESGYAAELALWGTLPRWSGKTEQDTVAEIFALGIVRQYQNGSLVLSDLQKAQLLTIIGRDETVGRVGDMIVQPVSPSRLGWY
jgi:hypothetical protein